MFCVALGLGGCTPRRPSVTPVRTIEPALAPAPAPDGAGSPRAPADTRALELRLLATEARGHIGRRVLHQKGDGEVIEDAVWRWSSPPERYLDTALRVTLGSGRDIRLVDSADATSLAVTLLSFHVTGESDATLLAVIELRFTGADRIVHTKVIRDSEPIAGALPGDLSAGVGRLLGRLATQTSQQVIAMR